MAWEEQKKEIDTIKERTFQIRLSDADVKRIFDQAGKVNLSPEELLENFIGDLVDGTYSNGSDERMLAHEWFERCGFNFMPEHTFLKYLIDDYRVDELLENVNDLKIYEKKIADYQEGLKNGWIKGRHRLSFAWDYDRGLPDGETAYESRAEWEQDLKDDLEVLKEEAAWKQKNIKELWQEYLDDRRTNDEDHGTMEEEIEKVRQWGERRRVVLDLEKQTGQENTSALEECMRHTASKSAQRQEQGRER